MENKNEKLIVGYARVSTPTQTKKKKDLQTTTVPSVHLHSRL